MRRVASPRGRAERAGMPPAPRQAGPVNERTPAVAHEPAVAEHVAVQRQGTIDVRDADEAPSNPAGGVAASREPALPGIHHLPEPAGGIPQEKLFLPGRVPHRRGDRASHHAEVLPCPAEVPGPDPGQKIPRSPSCTSNDGGRGVRPVNCQISSPPPPWRLAASSALREQTSPPV